MPGSPDRTSFTPGRVNVSPSDTQGGSRVPELGSLGSVRGALSNGRPYRDLDCDKRCQKGNLECVILFLALAANIVRGASEKRGLTGMLEAQFAGFLSAHLYIVPRCGNGVPRTA